MPEDQKPQYVIGPDHDLDEEVFILKDGRRLTNELAEQIHVEEISSNPWWSSVAGTDATRSNVLKHQLPGSPGLELMADVYDPAYDGLVTMKKRYDCFLHTDLEHAPRSLGVDTLLLTGVNTNSCVMATATAASVRDFSVVVLSDCVATMDSKLHQAALDVIAGAFGWVMDSRDAIHRVAAAQEGFNA